VQFIHCYFERDARIDLDDGLSMDYATSRRGLDNDRTNDIVQSVRQHFHLAVAAQR
jgi:hypothetical protein